MESADPPRKSATFDDYTLAEIRRAAATGIYDIRGGGAKRKAAAFRRPAVPRRLDLALSARGLPREVRDRRRLGTRFAKKPIELKIPITIAGMSFGALSANGQGSARAAAPRSRAPRPPPATAA
jgi:glutamate synthase domain-containing protein 2